MNDPESVSKPSMEATRSRAWRWGRRCLLGLALLATSIGIFYTVENLRGRRAWERYRRAAESKGRTFDWQALIPATVPDDQNFFKAPKMAEWFVRDSPEQKAAGPLFPVQLAATNQPILAEITLVTAETPNPETNAVLRADDPSISTELLRLIDGVVGPCIEGAQGSYLFTRRSPEQIKPAQIRLVATDTLRATNVAALFRGDITSDIRASWHRYMDVTPVSTNAFRVWSRTPIVTAADYLAASESVSTNLDLIRKALERPYARMDGDYRPFGRPSPDLVRIRTTVQFLAQRAQAELLLGQSGKAWENLSLIRGLCRILTSGRDGRPMTLVAGMIDVAVTGLYTDVVREGLEVNGWRDAELARIQDQLGEIDLPQLLRETFDCERVAACEVLEKTAPAERPKIFGSPSRNLWEKFSHPEDLLLQLAPQGWFYQNMAVIDTFNEKMAEALDSTNGSVRPREVENVTRATLAAFDHFGPYTFVARRASPNLIRAVQTMARNQAQVNEAILACALERYRFAHSHFPETLDELSPQFVDRLPHDVVNGEPLKYRRGDGEGYVLYSVGWNDKDEGGKAGKTIEDGDWVFNR